MAKKMEKVSVEVLAADAQEQRRFDAYRRNVDSSAVLRATDALVHAVRYRNEPMFRRIIADVEARFDLENIHEAERLGWQGAVDLGMIFKA